MRTLAVILGPAARRTRLPTVGSKILDVMRRTVSGTHAATERLLSRCSQLIDGLSFPGPFRMRHNALELLQKPGLRLDQVVDEDAEMSFTPCQM